MDYDAYLNEPLPFTGELSKYYDSRDKLIILEIGSCEGEDSIRLSRKFPNATIYTFEPLPSNVKTIKRNFTKYGLKSNHLYPIAMSDTNSKSDFYVSSGHPSDSPKTKAWDYGNKSSSLLAPKEHKKVHKWVKFDKKIQVKTQRLDSFCRDHGIAKIDFIYLDVQGAELMVLEGAGDLLKKVGAIWLEVEAIELYEGQPLKTDVEKFMESHGFVRIKDTVDRVSGDQLYVRSNLPRTKTGLLGKFLK